MCEAQENMLSSIVEGVKRRPPTEYIGLLTDDAIPAKGYYAHLRDRDEDLQHVVLIEDGGIRVFRIRDGVEANIQGATSTFDPDAFVAPQWITAIQGSSSTESPAANSEADDDCELLRAAETASGCIWSADSPFTSVSVKVTTPGEGTYTLHWEYTIGTDGSQGEWAELTVNDPGEYWKTAGVRTVSFSPPEDWVAALAYGSVRFHARCFYVSGTIDVNPLAGRVWIGYSGFDYLNIDGDDATAAFAVTSVADYSFVVNKEKVVAMTSEGASPSRVNRFLIHWIESGSELARDWQHDLGDQVGLDATFPLTPGGESSNTAPGNMIDHLISDVYDGTNFPLWEAGERINRNVCLVVQSDEETDGILAIRTPSYEYSDEVYAFVGLQTQRFSDLPRVGVDGYVTEITGADGNEENNYWVAFDNEITAWVETVGPDLDVAFDPGTMPHTLIQLEAYSDSTPDLFSFAAQVWGNRTKGDEDSAPEPSFVGKAISDVYFHKNRLGFLAEESVVLSEAGEFFNFWPTTVTTIVDSDPIDAASTNNRVALLDFAVPYDQKLYLFSGHGGVQNVLQSSGDTFTNIAAEVVEASAYSSSPAVRPVASGHALYFAQDRTVSTGLIEYTIGKDGANGSDETAHVPTYIPGNVKQLSVSNQENILIARSSDEANVLYIYAYFWSGGEKKQRSWSKWIFDEDYNILDADWVGSLLYLVVDRADGMHLEKIDVTKLTEGDLDTRVHFDSLVELTGVYTAADNLTRFTFPYEVSVNGSYRVVLSGTDHGDALGAVYPLTYEEGTDVVMCVEGDRSADTSHAGRTYDHLYEFTKATVKVPSEEPNAPPNVTTQGRLQIAKWTISVRTAGGFQAVVSSGEVNQNEIVTEEQEYTYSYPQKILDAGTVGITHPRPIDTFTFDVAMEGKYARIRITGNSHLPFTLVGAEWEGTFNARSGRI
jgi:hypothetical protein